MNGEYKTIREEQVEVAKKSMAIGNNGKPEYFLFLRYNSGALEDIEVDLETYRKVNVKSLIKTVGEAPKLFEISGLPLIFNCAERSTLRN